MQECFRLLIQYRDFIQRLNELYWEYFVENTRLNSGETDQLLRDLANKYAPTSEEKTLPHNSDLTQISKIWRAICNRGNIKYTPFEPGPRHNDEHFISHFFIYLESTGLWKNNHRVKYLVVSFYIRWLFIETYNSLEKMREIMSDSDIEYDENVIQTFLDAINFSDQQREYKSDGLIEVEGKYNKLVKEIKDQITSSLENARGYRVNYIDKVIENFNTLLSKSNRFQLFNSNRNALTKKEKIKIQPIMNNFIKKQNCLYFYECLLTVFQDLINALLELIPLEKVESLCGHKIDALSPKDGNDIDLQKIGSVAKNDEEALLEACCSESKLSFYQAHFACHALSVTPAVHLAFSEHPHDLKPFVGCTL